MILAYVPDLMDRSRLSGAVPEVRFVAAPGDLVQAAPDDVVVVDLSRPGVLDVIPTITARRVIGFGSHVERDLLAAAGDAGCTDVLARSAFFSGLPDLLHG